MFGRVQRGAAARMQVQVPTRAVGGEGVCVRARKRRPQASAMAALLLAASLVSGLFPCTAFGVVNLGSVTVSLQSGVSLASGSSITVSAACSPEYSDQLPNCMNDYCPSGCEFGTESSSGTACLDAGTGQCTCYGYSYTRYYPSCTVTSSDPSVARASWSNGVLKISGYRSGTATLTVYPTLRLFTSVPSSIAVTVNAASSDSGQSSDTTTDASSGTTTDTSSNTSSGTTTDISSGTAASTGSGSGSTDSSGSSGVSVSAVASTQSEGGSATTGIATVLSTIVSSASASDDGEDSAAGDAVASEDGEAETTYHIGDDGVSVPDLLKSIAGTDTVLTLWGGDDAEAPQYIWQIPGSKLSADDNLDLDLTVTDETSNEQLASLLEGIDYTALRIAQQGQLPGTMQLYWRTAAWLPNDAVVDVYVFDEETGTFSKAYSNLQTVEGYVCFNAAVGGIYVITENSDLESLGADDAEADGGELTQASYELDGTDSEEADSAQLPVAGIAIGAVVVIAAACAGVVAVRRKRAASAESAVSTGETKGDQ